MNKFYKNKTILVTGGAGSIGSELVRRLLELSPKVIRMLDNNETALFDLENELQSEKIRVFIGDVRDENRLISAFENVDIVFHVAALKHVPLCEYNPFEAVKTNIIGTQNVINASLYNEVERVILISTDKSVNPINVMGASKLLAERLITSANYYKGDKRTIFSCVRFGNVINSRGSVTRVFLEQIIKGGPLKVTNPDMTRFIMTMSRAVELVLKAAEIAEGGEIFIFKMSALRLGDLAEIMIDELAPKYGYTPSEVKIENIGVRKGEKIFEELMTREEEINAIEVGDLYILMSHGVSESKRPRKFSKKCHNSHTAKTLTREEIRDIIKQQFS